MRYIQGMPVNGVVLRTPEERDAQAMLELMTGCYDETEFLSCEPDEFRVSVEEEIAFLRRHERAERACMISAFVDGALVGNVRIGEAGSTRKVRHRAVLGISVRKAYWGRGVGGMLMDAAINTAQSAGYKQIELEVASDNERAIRLYERFGFEVCGRLPCALKRSDGTYADQLTMVKTLE